MIKKEFVNIINIEYQDVICPQCGLPMNRPHPFDAPETYGCPNCQVLEKAPYEGEVPYPRVEVTMTNGAVVHVPIARKKW